jgi:hypothetical protein
MKLVLVVVYLTALSLSQPVLSEYENGLERILSSPLRSFKCPLSKKFSQTDVYTHSFCPLSHCLFHRSLFVYSNITVLNVLYNSQSALLCDMLNCLLTAASFYIYV